MSNSQQVIDKGILPSTTETFGFLGAILTGVADFFTVLSRATIAARECEHLYRLGDSELAVHGLKREDIANHVVAKYLTV